MFIIAVKTYTTNMSFMVLSTLSSAAAGCGWHYVLVAKLLVNCV
jgi:hypothetical protein